jgi:hypothetical protein
MSYFNHAFQKVFIASGTAVTSGSTTALTGAQGKFGLFDPKTFDAYNTTGGFTPGDNPKAFMLATSSIHGTDKVGPYHGGYAESNKSKMINPRYVTKFWKVEQKISTQSLTIIGKTDDASTDACECPVFECGRTYRLRVDIKGSPALRFLNHQLYDTFDAYTGCCSNPAEPNNVDPVTVMIEWAKQILEHPFLSQFISPTVIYSLDAGSTWETALTTVEQMDDYIPVTVAGDIADVCVGIELLGAFVDTNSSVNTVFGDCSFKPTDHFEKEPIQIYASFVNDLDDICQHSSLCVTQAQLGQQGEGYGETIIRELILSESYAQNYFSCNPRIREITLGDDVFGAITRTAKYDVYYLQHSVPRFNNPTGTFDNDQYLLKLVIPAGANPQMDDLAAWIIGNCEAAGNDVSDGSGNVIVL